MKSNLERRKFLQLSAATVGGTLLGRAADGEKSRIVSLKDAHVGSLEIDLRIMNQYTTQPQEVQEFYTACRAAMTGGNPESEVAEVCRKFKRDTLGGPMLGDVTDTRVAVWMSLPRPDSVKVVVSRKEGEPLEFSSKEAGRFLWIACEGLSPDTEYSYQVVNSEKKVLGEGSFTTFPSEISEKPFKIAFGTCYHKVGMYRPELMTLIRERGNRAMLLGGDIAVDGRKDDFGLINADYLLRDLSKPWRELSSHVPVTALWDDHDYWGNDTSGRFTNGKKPIDVEGLRRSWREHWNNPEREIKREGIYFQTQLGPIHYIGLDTRSCRVDDERGKLNSFLGAEQMAWLKRQIQESTAPFVVISGGTMWSDNISAGKDSWGTWDIEGREEIFQVIDGKKDSTFILISGDRHGARGIAIPRPDGSKFTNWKWPEWVGCRDPGPMESTRSSSFSATRDPLGPLGNWLSTRMKRGRGLFFDSLIQRVRNWKRLSWIVESPFRSGRLLTGALGAFVR